MVSVKQQGTLLLVLALALGLALATALAGWLGARAAHLGRDRESDRALAIAREALGAYASARPIDAQVGPGYLPCPDLDGDGWAEATCGSLSGHTGAAQRLGRLPWKTLGIAELRDGYGEPLWYAVSAKHKGLLNCAASAACMDMGPEAALGAISVRDPAGAWIHDGRIDDPRRSAASGAVAVLIAPGPPLERRDESTGQVRLQARPGALRADPAQYLDHAGVEDNADFTDRGDVRDANTNGFIAGPVRRRGELVVNDRLAVLTYDELMPRVMRRVALEVLQCLRAQAALDGGRMTDPAPTCRQADALAEDAWTAQPGTRFGRVADGVMQGCALATADAPGWWEAWRRHVFVALGVQPVDAGGRLLGGRRTLAVLVAGAPLPVQSRDGRADADVREWLEGEHRELERLNPNPAAPGCAFEAARGTCPPQTCDRVVIAARDAGRNDVVVVWP